MPLRVLCVTRASPPVVGGMEQLSFDFTRALAARTPTTVIANRRGKAALPWFLPYAAVRLRHLAPHQDVVHLGDALLTVLAPFVPRGLPVAVTVHGLDIRFPHPLYQALLRRFLPRVHLALCISRFVESELRQRFPQVRTMVMNPCSTLSSRLPKSVATDFGSLHRPSPGQLLAVARLVPRKGLAWFVAEVLPRLPDAHLTIVGDGPERPAIAAAAARAAVSDRVVFAGKLTGDALQTAYRSADLLVMPNIPVPGDAEGFGLVALEAAAAGLPVVAANLEGIPDAVVDGETGVLARPQDADAWVAAVRRLLENPDERQRLAARGPAVVRERFSWDRRADEVLAAVRELL